MRKKFCIASTAVVSRYNHGSRDRTRCAREKWQWSTGAVGSMSGSLNHYIKARAFLPSLPPWGGHSPRRCPHILQRTNGARSAVGVKVSASPSDVARSGAWNPYRSSKVWLFVYGMPLVNPALVGL